MSDDVKKLSDVFKASPEATSLESTDRVLSVDANGGIKRIRRDRLAAPYVYFNNISTPQWVRIGKFSSGACALIKIFSVWHNIPGNNILVDMLLHPNSDKYNAATVLSRMSNSANYMLPKLRVVRKYSSECYIDLYYNSNTAELVYIYLIHGQGVTLLTPEPDAQIPEGYTAVEFDISTVLSGGVKRYRLTTYAIMQKGGRRDGGNEVNYQRLPQGDNDRCSGITELPRFRYIPATGTCDRHRREHHKPSDRSLQIRSVGLFRCQQFVSGTDILPAPKREAILEGVLLSLYQHHWHMVGLECHRISDSNIAGKGVAA